MLSGFDYRNASEQQQAHEGLMAKQQRGNPYLLERLKNEHPALYADLQAGKFPSARQALIASGLRKPPKPLNDLKRAWSNASPAEQAEFRRLIGMPGASVTTAAPTSHAAINAFSASPTASSATTSVGVTVNTVKATGQLEPWADARIQLIMNVRRMKMGDVLDEMGYKKRNPSLGLALNAGTRIQPHMAVALDQWLKDNSAVK